MTFKGGFIMPFPVSLNGLNRFLVKKAPMCRWGLLAGCQSGYTHGLLGEVGEFLVHAVAAPAIMKMLQRDDAALFGNPGIDPVGVEERRSAPIAEQPAVPFHDLILLPRLNRWIETSGQDRRRRDTCGRWWRREGCSRRIRGGSDCWCRRQHAPAQAGGIRDILFGGTWPPPIQFSMS